MAVSWFKKQYGPFQKLCADHAEAWPCKYCEQADKDWFDWKGGGGSVTHPVGIDASGEIVMETVKIPLHEGRTMDAETALEAIDNLINGNKWDWDLCSKIADVLNEYDEANNAGR